MTDNTNLLIMAGHSKWANIKHRKQSVDGKRSQTFQKLIIEISRAALQGTDVNTNSLLKAAIARAKAANMPKNVIMRAIEKQHSSSNQQIYWNEARFAKHISLLIKIESDNLIRTLNQIKKIAQKTKLELLPGNSIRYLFQRQYFFQLAPLKENELFALLDGIVVHNFFLNATNTQVIFTEPNAAKTFHMLLSKQKIFLDYQTELFVPLNQICLPTDLSNEYNLIKEQLLQLEEVKTIFDDLNPKTC